MLPDTDTVALGTVAQLEMGQAPSSAFVNDQGVGVPFLQGNAEFGAISPNHSNYCSLPGKLCRAGDVLISVRAPVGAMNKADRVYCIGRGLAAVRFTQVLPAFGWHMMHHWSHTLDRVAQGSTFEAISKSDLHELRVRIFPETEQCRIAEILDAADAAIQASEALIAKLKQAKAGLLHGLLTRGLDEAGRLRDPVAHPEQFRETALGLLPREWEVRALSEIAEVGSGVTLGRDLRGPDTVELPYLRVANVQEDYLDLETIKTVRVRVDEVPRYLLRPGDVLMTEGGDFDKLGRGTVWRGEVSPCLHQNHIFRVRADPASLVSEFLSAVSSSIYGKKYFLLSSKQSTNLASINSTQLKAFPVPCPHLREQHRIVEILEASDARIRTEEATLAKLRETKKGLMDDLLTGRVRVSASNSAHASVMY